MAQSDAATTAAVLTGILKQSPGNSVSHQRARVLLALFELGSVTTVEATRFLDIIDPRARVFELRNLGYCIATRADACATECGIVHIMGRYVLVSSGQHRPAWKRNDEWTQLALPLNV